ncbi:MAG: NAD-dependent epimerase/dehydratase family protein [Candidatus Nanopelagicales bacterium]
MRYAMTGATGFVGGALARLLIDRGHSVVATVRSPDAPNATALADLGVEVVRAALGDPDALAAAFAGADGLFHVAGWYKTGAKDSSAAWSVNVDGTRTALAAAADAGVPRVVYTSTCAINSDTGGVVRDESFTFQGKHLTVYDESKARAHAVAEGFARDQVLDVVIVMPGGIYGPGDTSTLGTMMREVAAGKRVVAPSSLRMVEAYVDDVAAGHLLAMQRGESGESYMLAGEQTNAHALMAYVAELTGGHRPFDMPAPALSLMSKIVGPLSRVLPLPPEFSAEGLRASGASYLGSPDKAIRELGWSFRPLSEGIAETVAGFELQD